MNEILLKIYIEFLIIFNLLIRYWEVLPVNIPAIIPDNKSTGR